MKPDVALLQKRIVATRARRKLTLQQVADGSGLSKSYVWELEKGSISNPTIRAVWSVAGALGVTPAYLMGLDDTENQLDPLALKLATIINTELEKRAKIGANHD